MKKLIKFLLAFAMVMTIGSSAAFADTQGMALHTDVMINPMYKDVITDEQIDDAGKSITNGFSSYTQILKSLSTVTESVDEAGAVLREQMVNRVTDSFVTLQVPASTDTTKIENQIFEAAVSHNGVPTEGDYLKASWYSRNTSWSTYTSSTTKTIELEYHIEYTSTASQEAVLDEAVDSLMDSLALTGKTDYEKIHSIYTYMCSNIEYDYDHVDKLNNGTNENMTPHSAYAALVEEKAVCQGYASLFYRLALEYGIDCRYITGTSFGEGHAWNIVELNNKYYNLDSTWDASPYGAYYDYFLKGSADFDNHTSDEEYLIEDFTNAYPISVENYSADADREDTTPGSDFEYSITDGTAQITAYTGNDKKVVVPDSIDGYKITGIATGAFYSNDIIEELIFSEGIETLAGESIVFCDNLKYIYFPSTLRLGSVEGAAGLGGSIYGNDNLAEIEVSSNSKYAVRAGDTIYSADMKSLLFHPPASSVSNLVIPEGVERIEDDSCRDNLNLNSVKMPDSVKYIGYWSFINDDNLEEINISESCEVIGQFVFTNNKKITELYVPASVTNIMADAFSTMRALERITVSVDNPYYFDDDGVLYSKESLLAYPAAKENQIYSIKEGTKIIENSAFYGAENLKTVVFPSTLKEIGHSVFFDCYGLETLVFNSNIKAIDDHVFANDNDIKDVFFLGNCPSAIDEIIENIHPLKECNLFCLDDDDTYDDYISSFETKGFSWKRISKSEAEELLGELYPDSSHDHADYEVVDPAVEPTCTEAGKTEGSHCSLCGEVIEAQQTIPAAHKWDMSYTVDKDATCTATGSKSIHCSVCDVVKPGSSVTVEKTGHTAVTDNAVAATCTKAGKTEGSHCGVCGVVIEAQKTVPAGHKWENSYTTDKKATCKAEGSKSIHCSACDAVKSGSNVTIPKTAHTKKTTTTKATLSKDGKAVTKCSTCNSTLSTKTIYKVKSVSLSKTKYTYDGKKKAPTVTVKDSKGAKLVKDTDYTVTYSSGRIKTGRYKATITFKGNYTGSKTLYFTIVPKAPANLKAQLYGHDDIRLSWSKSTGASGYTVYYKRSIDKSYRLATRLTGTAVRFKDLYDGSKYQFKVLAYYKSGGTRYGSTTYATASKYTLKQMSAPKASKSGTKAKISWSKVNGAHGYHVAQYVKKNGKYVKVKGYYTTSTSKLFTATKGKTYYYKVRAYDKVNGVRIFAPWSKMKAYKR